MPLVRWSYNPNLAKVGTVEQMSAADAAAQVADGRAVYAVDEPTSQVVSVFTQRPAVEVEPPADYEQVAPPAPPEPEPPAPKSKK